jgi:hypothetical protein
LGGKRGERERERETCLVTVCVEEGLELDEVWMGHYAHHLELSVLGRRPAEVEARTGSGKIKERKSMSALLKLLGESTEHAGGELDLYLID